MQTNSRIVALALARSLPVRDDNCESDLISLVGIVITGIEVDCCPHFRVRKYDPNADGVKKSFAVLAPLYDSGMKKPVELWAETARLAVAAYLESRLDGGLSLEEAGKLVDGTYTDAIVADSVLQFALYGRQVYS